MRSRLVMTTVLALLVPGALAACGAGAEEQDLCTQYEELVLKADELRAQEPLTAKAEDLRSDVEAFQAELDQFQAVSEGRLDAAVSTLRANVDALRQAAVEDLESLSTARPLLEETMQAIDESWDVVVELAEVQCPGDQ